MRSWRQIEKYLVCRLEGKNKDILWSSKKMKESIDIKKLTKKAKARGLRGININWSRGRYTIRGGCDGKDARQIRGQHLTFL